MNYKCAVGRQKKKPGEILVEVPCKVPEAVADMIEMLATNMDRSKSQIARKFLLRGLAAYKRDGLLDEPPSLIPVAFENLPIIDGSDAQPAPPCAPKAMIWRNCMNRKAGRLKPSGAACKWNGSGCGAHRRRAWLRWMICCGWRNDWPRMPRHCRPTISGQSCTRSACELWRMGGRGSGRLKPGEAFRLRLVIGYVLRRRFLGAFSVTL